MITVEHAPEHVVPTVQGYKDTTIRYEPPTEYRPGVRAEFVTPDGEMFAEARIKFVTRTEVATVPMLLKAFRSSYPHSKTGPIIDQLEEHYDRQFSLDDRVVVVKFTIIQDHTGGDYAQREGHDAVR